MRAARIVVLIASVSMIGPLSTGCGSDEQSGSGTDTGADSTADAGGDIAEDIEPDSTSDTGEDVDPDSGEDVAPDTVADVDPDAVVDADEDVEPDAVEDADEDVAPDTDEDADPDVSDGDTSTDTDAGDTGLTDEELCSTSGGSWHEDSCGDYFCGDPPLCAAIIPGCDCGDTQNFVPGEGCVDDRRCEGNDRQVLCEETGGEWDPESCGDYVCDERPSCRAVIPGCDCGRDEVFDDELGCVESSVCTPEGQTCLDTGGAWDEASCGDYVCGDAPDCEAVIPGCDCGPCANYAGRDGCVPDDECGCTDEEVLCQESGGMWDEFSCGHWACGEIPDCDAIIPGCRCPEDSTFDEELGCVVDDACTEGEEAELCVTTGGEWTEGGCGDAVCGTPPPIMCLVPEPGCDCGFDSNFDPREGCVRDAECGEAAAERCALTGGEWFREGCAHWSCGVASDIACLEDVGECNCGPGLVYDSFDGCVLGRCDDNPEILCDLSGGTWDESSCGDYRCGVEPSCDAIIPGCDCGRDSVFEDRVGCVTSTECEACPDPRNPAVEYVSTDPEVCTRIFFDCERGAEPFTGECGCGCIGG